MTKHQDHNSLEMRMTDHQQKQGNTLAAADLGAPKSNTLHIKVPDKAGVAQVQPVIALSSQPSTIAAKPASTALVVKMPTVASKQVMLDREPAPLPHNLHRQIRLFLNQDGDAFAEIRNFGNPYVLLIGSKKLNACISDLARRGGIVLCKKELIELNELLEQHAEHCGMVVNTRLRIAPIEGGIEIDVGDQCHTRIRITAGSVQTITSGSEVLFYRTANTKPMVMPAPIGDVRLLNKFLNVSAPEMILLIAWISYTLAHPKVASSKYPILVLQGNEGSGKSSLCKNIIIRIIDPSAIGVQVFPQNAKDLAIAGQNAHVLCYDNLRVIKAFMADMLCIAATGGTVTGRQLYTDAEQKAIHLHVALVLNGIHSFIDTPDLSQRCLPIHLVAMEKSKRKSDDELACELEADLPAIMRGLFELIASIFLHLPSVEITNPERMIDFVAWLAAMEIVDGVPAGVYQGLYSNTLQQGQLDTLMDNPLAAALIEFADKHNDEPWSGTPAALLTKLSDSVSYGTLRSREWPQNPIALSKRIAGLQSGLLSQGIKVELTRGKQRTVMITKVGG